MKDIFFKSNAQSIAIKYQFANNQLNLFTKMPLGAH